MLAVFIVMLVQRLGVDFEVRWQSVACHWQSAATVVSGALLVFQNVAQALGTVCLISCVRRRSIQPSNWMTSAFYHEFQVPTWMRCDKTICILVFIATEYQFEISIRCHLRLKPKSMMDARRWIAKIASLFATYELLKDYYHKFVELLSINFHIAKPIFARANACTRTLINAVLWQSHHAPLNVFHVDY